VSGERKGPPLGGPPRDRGRTKRRATARRKGISLPTAAITAIGARPQRNRPRPSTTPSRPPWPTTRILDG